MKLLRDLLALNESSKNFMSPVKVGCFLTNKPAHGGNQKDVKNKSEKDVIQKDEKSNTGKVDTKDRPFVKAPRLTQWLAGSTVLSVPACKS